MSLLNYVMVVTFYHNSLSCVAGKLNQEKDKEIQKLTQRVNELQREAIVMSKTMQEYSATAAKGKALVDAFYPAPRHAGGGGGAAAATGGVSLSSDEKTFSGRDAQRSRSHFLHWDSGEKDDASRGGGDNPLTRAAETDSELVAQLRQELHRVQVGAFETIASLRSRLAWFADNQVGVISH